MLCVSALVGGICPQLTMMILCVAGSRVSSPFATSSPSVTSPKTTCFPSKFDVFLRVMKNCDLFRVVRVRSDLSIAGDCHLRVRVWSSVGHRDQARFAVCHEFFIFEIPKNVCVRWSPVNRSPSSSILKGDVACLHDEILHDAVHWAAFVAKTLQSHKPGTHTHCNAEHRRY